MAKLSSGVITVTTAGTAVQGPSTPAPGWGLFIIRAQAGNTGVVYVGNVSGDVASTNGLEMSAGDYIVWEGNNLSDLWFDAATSGDKFSWLLSRIGK